MFIIACAWCVDNGEWFERLLESLLMLLWIVQCYENGHILFICMNMSFALFWDMVVKSVMCIEKEWEFKEDEPFRGTYRAPRWILYFEGRIVRRDGYYIEGRVVRRDRCMDRCVPHGSRTERQRLCIIRSDMHHYTWHCIPLHCTYLLLVNSISCFADLLIASCGTCDRSILSLLLRICNLLKYCCWGYVIC